ncbi:MAG: hypothetical protein HOV76_32250 [Hamadaea sp.]|nr:hypothetical protein [Hamadaea sp.]
MPTTPPDPDPDDLSLTQRWAAERVSGRETFLLVATAVVRRPLVMIGKGLYAVRWIVLGPWQLVQILRYLRRSRDE